MPIAPIAVFAFKRPAHTRRLLASLRANPEADRAEVHVFCDGPRGEAEAEAVEATRAAVRSAGLARLSLVERPRNVGLAANVMDGVGRLCDQHGRVVVLEDDLVVSPAFLAYANAALDRYAGDDRVMHISGYQYAVEAGRPGDAVFLPFISSWGWATWARAWRHFDPQAAAAGRVLGDPALRRRFDIGGTYGFSSMLELQRAGRLDSWAIRWYLSVFARDGLALFPAVSLVENGGVGAGATHTRDDGASPLFASRAHDVPVARFPAPAVDERALRAVRRLFESECSLSVRVARKVRRIWRRVSGR